MKNQTKTFSPQEKNIPKAIKNTKEFIIKKLKGKGMLSLILVGTITNKKERTPNSDIDFFAIVTDGFDFGLEEKVNAELEKKRHELSYGYECRIRCFNKNFLKGGKPRTKVHEFITAPRLVQRLPFHKVVWGKKFDYKKEFVKPMPLKQELQYLIRQTEETIRRIKNKTYKLSIHNFYKTIIELARVDAQIRTGFKYHPDRYKLAKHLEKEKHHVVHKAMKLRNEFHKKTEQQIRKDTLKLCEEAENYLEELKQI